MSFEYDYFLGHEKYGYRVAQKYAEFLEETPLPEKSLLKDIMEHMKLFCKSVKLPHPEVFFEIEHRKDEVKMSNCRRYAAVGIMIRGGNTPAKPALRKSIEQRVQEHEFNR